MPERSITAVKDIQLKFSEESRQKRDLTLDSAEMRDIIIVRCFVICREAQVFMRDSIRTTLLSADSLVLLQGHEDGSGVESRWADCCARPPSPRDSDLKAFAPRPRPSSLPRRTRFYAGPPHLLPTLSVTWRAQSNPQADQKQCSTAEYQDTWLAQRIRPKHDSLPNSDLLSYRLVHSATSAIY